MVAVGSLLPVAQHKKGSPTLNLIPVIAWGGFIYCALLAVALLVTYHTPARRRARRIKKCATRAEKELREGRFGLLKS